MAMRRNRGDGGLSWNEARQRWIGRVSLGYFPSGKRRIGTVSGRTKTEAQRKLRQLIRDQEDGLPYTRRDYLLADAVSDWLAHGLTGRDPNTIANRTSLARTHVIPDLGRRRLVELTAEEIDHWLAAKARMLSSDTVPRLLGIVRAAIRRAQAREYVRRNVALCATRPRARPGGRRSH